LGDIRYDIDADPQRAVQKLSRVVAKQEQVIQKLHGTNRAGRKTGGTFSKVTKSLSSMISVGAGLSIITRFFQDMKRQGEEAQSTIDSMFDSMRRLSQIAKTPEEFQKFRNIAFDVSKETGLALKDAVDLTFSALSSEFTPEQIKQFAPVQSTIDLAGAFRTVELLRTQFKGTAGTPEQILAQVLAGSKKSPLGFEEVGPGTARAAAAFSGLGGTIQETIAATAFAAKGEKPEEAVTGIRAFADELAKKDAFVGRGLIDSIKQLRDQFGTAGGGVDEERLAAFFSNTRARAGAKLLVPNLDTLQKFVSDIERGRAQAGTPEGPIQTAIGVAQASPILESERRARQAERTKEIAGLSFGTFENAQQAILDLAAARIKEKQAAGEIGRITSAARRVGLGALDLVDLSLENTAGFAAQEVVPPFFGGKRTEEDQATIDRMNAIVERFDGASKNLESAANRMSEQSGAVPVLSDAPAE